MASELESLLVRLEADTTGLRRALAQAEGGLDKHETKVQRSLGNASKQFDKFNASAAKSLQGVGAALASVFATQKIKADIVDVVALDRAAQMAGLTAAELQKLNAAARNAGLGGDAMTDAMKELAVKVSEVKTRSGGFYEFLSKQLPTVDAQIRGTKSTGEAMDIVAETVRRLTTAEEKAAFAKQALGEKGLFLISTLSKGSEGLREAGAEADKYGQVLSDSAIKNTVALGKELDSLAATLSTKFREALGSAAPVISGFIKGVREGLTGANGTNKDMFAALNGDGAAKDRLLGAGSSAGARYVEGFAASAKKALDSGAAFPAADALKLKVQMPDFETSLDFTGADAMTDLRLKVLESTGETFAAIGAEYDRDLERFRRMLAEKQISDKEFNEAREQLSIASGQKIGEAYAKETEAIRKLGDGFANTMDSAFGDAFTQLLEKGKLDFKAFSVSLIADLAKVYIQMQLLRPIANAAGGALAGAFGSLGGVSGTVDGAGGWATAFSGVRASGGPVMPGGSYLVGERGPERFTPSAPGNISPSASSGRGGDTYNIDARGADAGVEQRIYRAMAEIERKRQSAPAQLADARKRFPTR